MLVQQQVAESSAGPGFVMTTADHTGVSTTVSVPVPVGAATYELIVIGHGGRENNFSPGLGGGGGACSLQPPTAVGALTALFITFPANTGQNLTTVQANDGAGAVLCSANGAPGSSSNGANTTTNSPVGTTKYAGGTSVSAGGGGAGGPSGAGSNSSGSTGGAGGGSPAGAGGNTGQPGNGWGGGAGDGSATYATAGVRIIWRP